MDFASEFRSVWLKVQLGLRFIVAYILIFSRNENSMWIRAITMATFSYLKKGFCFEITEYLSNRIVCVCVSMLQDLIIVRHVLHLGYVLRSYDHSKTNH